MTTVLHLITSPCGGGAESIVRDFLNAEMDDIDTRALYFNNFAPCCKGLSFSDKEDFLGVGYRNPFAIYLIRKKIVKLLSVVEGNLVVHAHLSWAMLFLSLATIGLKVDIFYTEHDTTNRRRKYPFIKYIERFFYSRFKKIVCISEGTRKTLMPWLGKKFDRDVLVIPNGAKFYGYIERTFNHESIKFISIGSLIPKKGFDIFIKFLSQWEFDSWSYTIVGEGSSRNELEALIASHDLSDKIKLVGWSNNVEKYFHDSDIQIIPSRFEGFGLVAVEGMSTGLPVVASDVQGLNEVLEKSNGRASYLVSDFENEKSWEDAIELCIDSLKLDEFSVYSEARDNAHNFSIKKMHDAYRILWLS
ncbi:glycosyltransferase [Cycloclasticus pugetii]|uniref:glycosyltransferase n=1 Tax=Cycloclasticus pugetii TaxID=34068 RepID=UPI003A8D8945